MNPAEFLAISSAVVPEREALVSGDGAVRRRYAEMAQRVDQLTGSLLGMGVRQGSRVAVMSTNSPEVVELYYACAKLGACFVPLNFRAKLNELTYMLNASQASIVFVGSRYLDMLRSISRDLSSAPTIILLDGRAEGILDYESVLDEGSNSPIDAEVDLEQPTALIFTSGTTALPKGVELTFLNLSLYVINTMSPADPDGEHEKTLTSVSMAHVAGLTAILSSIWGGRTLITLPQFDPESWLQAVEREKVTHTFVVPTALKRIIEYPYFDRHDLSSLRLITYGAAPMPFDVVCRAIEVFDCGLMNAYGQTESTSSLTYLGPDDHRMDGTAEENAQKLHRLRSVGRPMDDVQIGIFNSIGERQPVREEGEIRVRSDRVMKQYLNQADETAAAISDGWLHTGDQGFMDEDDYLFITGRLKDLIIRGGENISPGEIETVLDSHPSVEETAIIAVPDSEWGEVIKAIVVLGSDNQIEKEEIQSYCRERLASYKTPAFVAFVSELPRNQMGKVLKTDLRRDHGAADDN